jgi:hypothetical protein
MPQALITTDPNRLRSIEVWDISAIQGWHLLGLWQWLAWNRLKFLASVRRSDGILQYARKLLCSRNLAHPLKPPSCFCRGLTGFARTDVVVRLLIF